MFTALEYAELSTYAFKEGFPGYRPEVIESSNGDGNLDTGKKYSHITYGEAFKSYSVFRPYFTRCMNKAQEVAIELGIPRDFWPDPKASVVRVLEYPPGVGSHEHTDFDLFTLCCYRNIDKVVPTRSLYFGELIELVMPYHSATEHKVNSDIITQYSIVYFAMPSLSAVLPSGQTVEDWVAERKQRSRY